MARTLEALPRALFVLYVAMTLGSSWLHQLPWRLFIAFHLVAPLLLAAWGAHRFVRFLRWEAKRRTMGPIALPSNATLVRRSTGATIVVALWGLFWFFPPLNSMYKGGLTTTVSMPVFSGLKPGAMTAIHGCSGDDDAPLPRYRIELVGLRPIEQCELVTGSSFPPNTRVISPPVADLTRSAVLATTSAPLFFQSVVTPLEPSTSNCVTIRARARGHYDEATAIWLTFLFFVCGIPWIVALEKEWRDKRSGS